jgi:hypothetical protein
MSSFTPKFEMSDPSKTLRLRSVTGVLEFRSLSGVEASEFLTQDFRADGLVP